MFRKYLSFAVIGIGICVGGGNDAYSDKPTCQSLMEQCIQQKSCDPWAIAPYYPSKESSLLYAACKKLEEAQNDYHGGDKWDNIASGICINTCSNLYMPWNAACSGWCS